MTSPPMNSKNTSKKSFRTLDCLVRTQLPVCSADGELHVHAQTGTGEDVAGTLRAGVFVAQPLYGNTTIWTAEPPCRGRRDTVSLTA